MKPNQRGVFAVLVLFTALMFLSASFFVLNVARALNEQQKRQTAVDSLMSSALQLRAEALERLAERWSAIGVNAMSADNEGLIVDHGNWPAVERAAHELSSAAPGYKGRIKAVVTVLRGALGIGADPFQIPDDQALALGLNGESLWMKDDSGAGEPVSFGWLKRTWLPTELKGDPPETARFVSESTLPLLFFPGAWTIKAEAAGRLRWDVDPAEPIVWQKGNGGFPRTWTEALDGAHADPFRTPVYRPELLP